jgi:hypothetical protein
VATRESNGQIENLMLTGKGIQMLQLQGKSWLSVMFPVHKNGMHEFTNRYIDFVYVTL